MSDIGIGCRVVHVKDHDLFGIVTHLDESPFVDNAVVTYENGDEGYHRTTRLVVVGDSEDVVS